MLAQNTARGAFLVARAEFSESIRHQQRLLMDTTDALVIRMLSRAPALKTGPALDIASHIVSFCGSDAYSDGSIILKSSLFWVEKEFLELKPEWMIQFNVLTGKVRVVGSTTHTS